jgi:hypothetical protein
MKQIFKDMFSMWFELPYKEFFNILFWSFKLYLLVLAPYLTIITVGSLLFILFGGENYIEGIWSFTRAYFYDGHILNFIAWRVHLTWFVFCMLININEEL